MQKKILISLVLVVFLYTLITFFIPQQNEWKRVFVSDLGISFTSPTEISEPRIYSGETGKGIRFNMKLLSGSKIFVNATTKDYSDGKDSFGVGTEGFIEQDGKYLAISHGVVSDKSSSAFVPDEILRLKDGTPVLIQYGKNYISNADYPEASIKAIVNLPGPNFTGVGILLYTIDEEGPHPASARDIADFKKVMSSIEITPQN